MNHVCRIVCNKISRTRVGVVEIVNACVKPGRTVVNPPTARQHDPERTNPAPLLKILAASLALWGASAHALDTNTLPTGGKVTAGNATISQAGNALDIRQTTQRAALDWQSFNIGAAATVNFNQPSTNAVALNHIVGNEASQIFGKLNANGQVFFTNPNGMLFARGAQVNVGGILATTMSLRNEDFMAGNYRFTDPGSGTIRNDGIINVLGSAVLIGNNVQNAGTLVAATVTLAAGNTVAVDLTDDGLIRARVIDPALKAGIENSGSIDGALAVTMTAGQARDTLLQVVNNNGVIRAAGLTIKGGEIVLEGGKVENTGTITTSNANAAGSIDMTGMQVRNSGTLEANGVSGQGGRINVSAVQKIELTDSSNIRVDGAKGGSIFLKIEENGRISGDLIARGELSALGDGTKGSGGFVETSAARLGLNGVSIKTNGGEWLIDPIDFTIGPGSGSFTSNSIGADALSWALGSGAVTIATDASTAGNGDIFVNAPVSWSADTVLTLSAHRNINVNSDITATGSTAGLNFYYGGTDGITAPANGTGYSLNNGASITLTGNKPTLSIGNTAYTGGRAKAYAAATAADSAAKVAADAAARAAVKAADQAAKAADAAAKAADAAAQATDAAAKIAADAAAKAADAAAKVAADAAAKVIDAAAKAADAAAKAADAAAKAAAKTTDAAVKAAADAAAQATDAAAKVTDAAAKAAAKAADVAAKVADAAQKVAADSAAKAAAAGATAADVAAARAADVAAKAADAAARVAADAAAKAADAADAAAKAADAAAKAADAAAKVGDVAAADAAARVAADAAARAADAAAKAAVQAAFAHAAAAQAAVAQAAAAQAAPGAPVASTGTSSSAAIASADTSQAKVATDKSEDKAEDKLAAKSVVTTVVIGNVIVQKSAEQILQVEQLKGRMLICR